MKNFEFPNMSEDAIFVVIDIQERLVNAMDMETYGPNFKKALRLMATMEVPVVVTEQYPSGLGSTIPELKEHLPAKAPVFEKTAFSCWGAVEFAKYITARPETTLIFTGMESHVCLQQTVLEAIERGFKAVVLADAVCSRNEYDKKIALETMRQAGAVITTTEAVVFNWLKGAKHPQFKTVSKIVAGRI